MVDNPAGDCDRLFSNDVVYNATSIRELVWPVGSPEG